MHRKQPRRSACPSRRRACGRTRHHLDADAGGAHLGRHLGRIRGHGVGHRQDARLHRRQPQRERACPPAPAALTHSATLTLPFHIQTQTPSRSRASRATQRKEVCILHAHARRNRSTRTRLLGAATTRARGNLETRLALTCIVLDQDAEEALQGAQQGAVDHDRLLALVVRVNVLLRAAAAGPHGQGSAACLHSQLPAAQQRSLTTQGCERAAASTATSKCTQKLAHDTVAARPKMGRPQPTRAAGRGGAPSGSGPAG